MGRKKYNTEEEREAAMKTAHRERQKRYYERNKEAIREKHADYRAAHKDEISAKKADYYAKNKEEILAKQAEYHAAHKEAKNAYMAVYHSAPFGRAVNLVSGYRKQDKKSNRGECTIDAQWIVDNIFTQPCHYCGETDWYLLGCDRIDNTKPHTPENVVPCCNECNSKKARTPYDEYMRRIGKIA